MNFHQLAQKDREIERYRDEINRLKMILAEERANGYITAKTVASE